MIGKHFSSSDRLLSLDAFRGITIAGMLLVNNSGYYTYEQLDHAYWNGLTFADIIAPFFIWIIGVAMVFSLNKRLEQGIDRKTLLLQILRRSVFLFVIGIVLYNFPSYDLSSIRVTGVLQRIAICYLIGGSIYLYTKFKGQAIWIVGLVLGYWLVITYLPVPGVGMGTLEKENNIAGYVDSLLLKGHLFTSHWDPDGILSTVSSVATVLFGVITGQLLMSKNSQTQKTIIVFLGGIGLCCAGLILNNWVPINKTLWTGSFVFFTAGLALMIFSVFYFLIDVRKHKKWFTPLVIYGVNPIIIYFLSTIFTKLLFIIPFHGLILREFIYFNFYSLIYLNRLIIKLNTKNITLLTQFAAGQL